MDLNHYYLHAIQNGKYFDAEESLQVLERILQSRALKSRKLRGDMDTTIGGWNGIDYISLCDYSKRNNQPFQNDPNLRGYTSYDLYIKRSLSFILKKDSITAITPKLVEPVIFDWSSHYKMTCFGNAVKGRYSDYPDEVQVKDIIPSSNFEGMTVPIEFMMSKHSTIWRKRNISDKSPLVTEEVLDYLHRVRDLLKKYQVSHALYEVESQECLDSEESSRKAIEKIKKKIELDGF